MNKKSLEKLTEIVEAGQNGIFTTEKQHGPLLELGLVEVNKSVPDPTNKNKIATRATSKGIAALNIAAVIEEGNEDMPEPTTKPTFELEDDVAIPTVRRGRSGTSRYPFDAMTVGQSFHVAATEETPDPAKGLASTASGANRRYSVPAEDGRLRIDKKGNEVPVMVKTRDFIVRRVDATDVKGEGARVFRIA